MAKLAADIEQQMADAIANARDFYDYEVATMAHYVPQGDLLLSS